MVIADGAEGADFLLGTSDLAPISPVEVHGSVGILRLQDYWRWRKEPVVATLLV